LEVLKSSGEAVGSGPGIFSQTERAQLQKAEAMLERYLALGNDREEYFELTTPFVRESKEDLQPHGTRIQGNSRTAPIQGNSRAAPIQE
jgi:hypothetical protein